MTQTTNALKLNKQGFTIIELMIATTVVSVILLLVSIMMISIGGLYQKGISQAAAQDNVRSITDEITQQLQQTGTEPSQNTAVGGVRSWCIGSARYTYLIGKQIGTDTQHVLWRDKILPQTCPAIPAIGAFNSANPALAASLGGGEELIGPRSMLTEFTINGPTPAFTVTISIAVGDKDLFCDNGTVNDCSNTTASSHIWNPTNPAGIIRCKGSVAVGNSGRFCGTANLTTTAVRRL